jgi:hypothetical protein
MHQQPAHAPFGPKSFSNAGQSSGVNSRISRRVASDCSDAFAESARAVRLAEAARCRLTEPVPCRLVEAARSRHCVEAGRCRVDCARRPPISRLALKLPQATHRG